MSRRRRRREPVELELEILDLGHDGRGVARHEGKAVFVSGALPGERVRALRQAVRKSWDEATTIEVLQASPDRVEPRCPHFGTCGGCALQHLAAGAQIRAKQHMLEENFIRIGQVEPQRWLPPVSGDPWGYRRKARLGVRYVAKKGRTLVGFREVNGRYIADLGQCDTLVPQVGGRIQALSELFDDLEARERIPQIEVAAGDDRTALVFRNLDPLSETDRERLLAFGTEHGFAMFEQPGGADSVRALDGGSSELLYRLPTHGLEFVFEPLDFIQVNGPVNERMVDQALELLDPQPGERVLDLFCGLGNFSLPLAQRTGSVVGVEGEERLVQRAAANAARNGIDNADFHAADLFARPDAAPDWLDGGFDALLLDPPRSGADATLAWLPLDGVGRIVYVSCHPATLARDAGQLVREHGYVLEAAGVMDMFPHTAHVESIALFRRG